MLSKFIKAALVLAFGVLLFAANGADAAPKPGAATATSAAVKPVSRVPQVYCFRGLLNIFSYGMDDLCNKITAAGVPAKSLNHTFWPRVADDIIAAYRANPKATGPIVLIGHSLGANAVLAMAQYIGREGIQVDLVVTFDPTISGPISGNVRRYLNLYESNDLWGVPLIAGSAVENSNIRLRKDIDITGVNHGNIDKNQVLHGQVVAEVVRLVQGTPAKNPAKKKKLAPLPTNGSAG